MATPARALSNNDVPDPEGTPDPLAMGTGTKLGSSHKRQSDRRLGSSGKVQRQGSFVSVPTRTTSSILNLSVGTNISVRADRLPGREPPRDATAQPGSALSPSEAAAAARSRSSTSRTATADWSTHTEKSRQYNSPPESATSSASSMSSSSQRASERSIVTADAAATEALRKANAAEAHTQSQTPGQAGDTDERSGLGWPFDATMAAAMRAYRQHMVSVTGGNANQWIDALDESEEHYYYNTRTREAEWQLPHRAYVDMGKPALLDERQLDMAHRRAHEIAMAVFLEAQLNEAASGSSALQSSSSPPAPTVAPSTSGSRALRGQRVLEYRMGQDFQCAKNANVQVVSAKCDADLAALFEEPDGIGSKLAATMRAATHLVSPAHSSNDVSDTTSLDHGGGNARKELQYSSQLAKAAEELSRDFDALKQRYTAQARGPEPIVREALQRFAGERMSQVVQALADLHRREMQVENVGEHPARDKRESERRTTDSTADKPDESARAPSPATAMATAAAAQAMVGLSIEANAGAAGGGTARDIAHSDAAAVKTDSVDVVASASSDAYAPVNQSPSRSQIDLDSELNSPPASPAQSSPASLSRDLTRTFESELLEKSEHNDSKVAAAVLQAAGEAEAKVTVAQEQQRVWHKEALRARESAAQAEADAEAKERHASLLEEQLAEERVAAARERARADKAVEEAAQASAAVARAEAESQELKLELRRERERVRDSAQRQHVLADQATAAAGSAELAEARSAATSARVEADDAIEANAAHAEHIERLQRHATVAAHEAELQQKELEEVTEYAHELYRSYEALREKAEGWRTETAEARARLTEAEERVESLEAEAEALRNEHSQDQALAEHAHPGAEGDTVGAIDTTARPSVEALQLAEAAAEAAEAEIDKLRVEQLSLSRAAVAANERASALEAELSDSIARHDDMAAQMRDAREALAQAMAEKEVRQAELDLMRDRMPMPVEGGDGGSAKAASGGECVDTDALVRANTNAAAELAKRQQAIRDAEAQLVATQAQVRRQEIALMAASGAQEAERAERRVMLGASKSNGRSDVEEQLLNELRQRRRGEKRLEAELHKQSEATKHLQMRIKEERGTATEMIKLLQDEVRDCQGRFTFPVLFAACVSCAVLALLFVNLI